MSPSKPLLTPPALPPETEADDAANPWTDLAPDGAGLAVHDFLTTMFSHTSNGLRRAAHLRLVGGRQLHQFRARQ